MSKEIRKLWREYSPRGYRYLWGFCILNLFTNVISAWLIRPQLSRTITEPGRLVENLTVLAAWMVLATTVDVFRPYCEKHAGVTFFSDAITAYADKILYAAMSQVESLTPAKITACQDVINTLASWARAVGSLWYGIFGIVSALSAAVFFVGWKALLISIVYLIGGIAMCFVSKKIRAISKENHEVMKARNELLNNSINGAGDVRIYGQTDRISGEMKKYADTIGSGLYRKNAMVQVIYGGFNIIDYLGTALACALSVTMIVEGKLTVQDAITIVGLVQMLVYPIDSIMGYFDYFGEVSGILGDTQQIFSWEKEADGKREIEQFQDAITFDRVVFRYPNKTEHALKKMSLKIKRGQHVGICGEKGSGKSTIGKLLMKFYPTNGGSILIDGCPIEEISQRSFSRIFGCVQQRAVIFDGTIRDNIRFGKMDASDVEIAEVCKQVGIYDFITGLEDGFEYRVGPNGNRLSGGQQQCIAIARMLLRNPEVIVLDEATSALDNESERMVQKAIDSIDSSKTVISIAHRLTTIKNCDTIYVVGNGQVLESGTHEELLSRQGKYAKLWNN